MDENKDIFTKRKIIVFATAGILIGIGTEMLFLGPTFPFYFLFVSVAGSFGFFGAQKINNNYLAWGLIILPIEFIVIASQMPCPCSV